MDRAYKIGLNAVAITDHDTVSGHIKAIQHYKKNYQDKDFKLILGNEIYLSKEGMSKDTYEKGDKFYHFILLAKDKIGHEQLRKLSSRAWDRSFVRAIMRTPTYVSDLMDIVGEDPGHLVATTACLGGIPAQRFLSGGTSESIEPFLEGMSNLFGKKNFYIELQPSTQDDQIRYNDFMIKNFWNDYPFIFATDSHYLKASSAPIHKAFLNSKDGDREVDAFYSSAYLMGMNEINDYFVNQIDKDKIEVMRANSNKIADMCEFYDLAAPQVVPRVPTKITQKMKDSLMQLFKGKVVDNRYPYITNYIHSEYIEDAYFIGKIAEGFIELISDEMTKEYMDRLEYECEQLWETSIKIKQPISNYFNTMAKMIDIIWDEADSFVGVSRGSAAGFLINYCLGITQLDPLTQPLEMPAWRLTIVGI